MLIKYLYRSLFSVMAFASLFFMSNAHADPQTSDVDYSVTVEPSLSISVTSSGTDAAVDSVVLDLNPFTKTFDNKSIDIKVATNNATGYQLFMSTSNNKTTLDRDNSDGLGLATIDTLPTLSSGYDEDSFIVNKWGYRILASTTDPDKITSNYYPFILDNHIATNHTTTNGDNTTINFAAKIDNNQPAGTYTNTLVFNAVASYVPFTFDNAFTLAKKSRTSTGYYAMQDMSTEICNMVDIDEVTRLTDVRSGNYTYYIAKLKDGKCWMTQNLRLGSDLAPVNGETTLTPSDSDISSNYVLSNKLADGRFPADTITDDITNDPAIVRDTNAFYCTPDGTNNYIGCYYNWYTATAGIGTSSITGKDSGTSSGFLNGTDVDSSICPRGWVLPKGGPLGDFLTLYNQYPSASEMLVSNTAATDNTTGLPRPSFILSGLYYSMGGREVSVTGLYWSRTARSTGRGYSLLLNSTGVDALFYRNKYDGYSVRCLAQ